MEEFKEYINNKYNFEEKDFEYLYKMFKQQGLNLLFQSIVRAKSLMSNDFAKIVTLTDDGYQLIFSQKENTLFVKIIFWDGKNFKFKFKEFILFVCDFIKSYFKFNKIIKEINLNANFYKDYEGLKKEEEWEGIYYNTFELIEKKDLDYEIPLISGRGNQFGIDINTLNLMYK
ncbi:hypothetical protein [uncultured Clostridium sp.]|jgi:hypothetical protein|uniref:hypothetical protein n=1 Tax=uncultured Clostridium sp. TaxID=59620 RepID=UPI00260521DC|nr:hypothetical protein [uncultured Clostridium sp.]